MKLSIRNQLDATIESVDAGPAMTTVRALINGGHLITAAITTEAGTDLQLHAGSPIRILIKSTEVSVALDPVGRISVRNLLPGRIVAVDHGEVMSMVKIDIGSEQVITAAITKESAQELDLEVGVPVTALIKATNVAVWVP